MNLQASEGGLWVLPSRLPSGPVWGWSQLGFPLTGAHCRLPVDWSPLSAGGTEACRNTKNSITGAVNTVLKFTNVITYIMVFFTGNAENDQEILILPYDCQSRWRGRGTPSHLPRTPFSYTIMYETVVTTSTNEGGYKSMQPCLVEQ